MDPQIHVPKYFVADIDLAAICNCELTTVYRAVGLASSSGRLPRSWSSGVVRRFKRIGKPYEPNYSGYDHEHLWEWERLPELVKVVNEYIRTHPKTCLQKDSQTDL
jgi:hypothetical protein